MQKQKPKKHCSQNHNLQNEDLKKMQKDFKTGMILGLMLVITVVTGLSTRPNLSIKARTMSHNSAVHRKIGIPLQETTIGENQTKQANNEQHKEIKTERFHIVSSGETLSDISYKYYGSADKWQKILGANRLPVENPSKLRPGTKLIIPE
jgi:nucleoid-associated protein YgaU